MAQIVGIVGSYRREGVTDTVVSKVLESARRAGKSTQKIHLQDCAIEFCTNCRACMQPPGQSRVPCAIHDDDAEQVLQLLERSEGFVIGAPINMGHINALTQRLVERSVGFGYWPWGTRGGPKLRNSSTRHRAVLVSTSAAPAVMNSRLFGVTAIPALKRFARLTGAEVVSQIKVGQITDEKVVLSNRTEVKIARAARKLSHA